jgi:hypothetical protein
MIAIVESVRQELRAPYKPVCRELEVPYSSLMRWRGHRQAAAALIGKPGPAKVESIDFKSLDEEIRNLRFGQERTGGSGELYAAHRSQISRRDLQALVEAVRAELQQKAQARERRVEWLVPGLVWSMDDMQRHWLQEQPFGHVHAVRDLGSHCQLRVLGDDVLANGWHVAMNLEDLIHQHGAPLFLKVDGGSNFKHQAVWELLEEYWIIRLLSPPHYPPYNGGIERGHQEILRELAERIGNEKVSARVLRLECELSGHALNHKRRRSLGGRTACSALETRHPLLRGFGRRERKEAFEEIKALTVDIAGQLQEHTGAAAETAFRYAAETWMQLNHMIRVTRNGEVLPPFYRFRSH